PYFSPLLTCSFFFSLSSVHRHLPSFPTRRSSDLSPSPRSRRCYSSRRPAGRTARKSRSPAVWDTEPRGGAPSSRLSSTAGERDLDRKSTRLNSSHVAISYAVFCLKKKKKKAKKQT